MCPILLFTRPWEGSQLSVPGFETLHAEPPARHSGTFSSGPACKWLGLHDLPSLPAFPKSFLFQYLHSLPSRTKPLLLIYLLFPLSSVPELLRTYTWAVWGCSWVLLHLSNTCASWDRGLHPALLQSPRTRRIHAFCTCCTDTMVSVPLPCGEQLQHKVIAQSLTVLQRWRLLGFELIVLKCKLSAPAV